MESVLIARFVLPLTQAVWGVIFQQFIIAKFLENVNDTSIDIKYIRCKGSEHSKTFLQQFNPLGHADVIRSVSPQT